MKSAKFGKKKRGSPRQALVQPAPPKTTKKVKNQEVYHLIPVTDESLRQHTWAIVTSVTAIFLLTLILYGKTLWELEYQWRTEADYSHGYLIPFLSLGILYSRRDTFPGFDARLHWLGVVLLLFAGLLKAIGLIFFMEFLEGWSIVPWVGGCVALFLGPRALLWAAPAVLFLLFMVPLPFQVETLLSWKLQSLVTILSSAALRILGFPAVSEGNTIWIGQSQMLVEEACSGLRIFVGMAAFAFFWVTLIRRAWIDKWIVIASIIPLAVIANCVRSVIVCISYHWFDVSVANRVHDWAGIFMIGLAASLVWMVKQYWERLYRPDWVSIPANRSTVC
jgi:exosortase